MSVELLSVLCTFENFRIAKRSIFSALFCHFLASSKKLQQKQAKATSKFPLVFLLNNDSSRPFHHLEKGTGEGAAHSDSHSNSRNWGIPSAPVMKVWLTSPSQLPAKSRYSRCRKLLCFGYLKLFW